MPCYGPLTGYFGKEVSATGKRPLTFDVRKAFTGVPVVVPCGCCIGCLLERARQWAVRCMHEAKMWQDNCFLTLTYDNDHLPKDGSLVKSDLQLFMKRLRFRKNSSVENPVRFYGCGEYGDVTFRPHYHVLLFNCAFRDKLYHTENARGEKLYTSCEVRELWPVGHNVIGDVSFTSARYVTGYVTKKVNKVEQYMRLDAEGRCYSVLPEFSVMSRRPGVGALYYARFGKELRTHDNVIVDGKAVPGTRFYDTRSELQDPSAHVRNKRKRKLEAVKRKWDNSSRRRLVKETVVRARLAQKGKVMI